MKRLRVTQSTRRRRAYLTNGVEVQIKRLFPRSLTTPCLFPLLLAGYRALGKRDLKKGYLKVCGRREAGWRSQFLFEIHTLSVSASATH